jgi:hypothetical protein
VPGTKLRADDIHAGLLRGPAQQEVLLILNIIDRRNREHRWKSITAIIEPTCHDNSCQDSDQADEGEALAACAYTYEGQPEISLADAVAWAHAKAYGVTLYLYDLGEGINAAGRLGELVKATLGE